MARLYVLILGAALCAGTAHAQVTLPRLVGDSMVLQRDTRLTLWGWASPGQRVRVVFKGEKYSAQTGTDGRWTVSVPPQPAGGPYTMDINDTHLRDILVGDVWFCSGQSNMVLPMERVKEKYPEEIARASYPRIRNFFVPTASDVRGTARDLPGGRWVAANPFTVLGFGAASWFFAREIYDRYQVPIGIINASVGGTPIQAWISAGAIHGVPAYAERLAKLGDTAYVSSLTHKAAPVHLEADKGAGGPHPWFDPAYVPQGWHPFWLPGYWDDQGVKDLHGVVWFRKEVDVPEAMTGQAARLVLGRIVDADQVYVNGVLVGNTTYQYPPRRYVVPAGLLRPGKNLLVMRVSNTDGKGGFVPDKPYFLACGDQRIDLRGDWQYKVGQVFPPMQRSMEFSAQNEPTGLYNTMVAPATGYAVKGFVWYQGEANAGKPGEYALLLRTLIGDWRERWGEGPLPFLYVQLPNFMEVQYLPSESGWAALREAQLQTLSVPHTAMAVAIDVGEWNDIHPLDKEDVGHRLALCAEKLAYGDSTLVASGPLYRSASVEGDSIIVSFTSTGGGLIVKGGGDLAQFAIAGADKHFIWARAVIRGDQVVVSNGNVPHPLYVRYAWADNPEGANLYNKEGLPASPFRTDGAAPGGGAPPPGSQ